MLWDLYSLLSSKIVDKILSCKSGISSLSFAMGRWWSLSPLHTIRFMFVMVTLLSGMSSWGLCSISSEVKGTVCDNDIEWHLPLSSMSVDEWISSGEDDSISWMSAPNQDICRGLMFSLFWNFNILMTYFFHLHLWWGHTGHHKSISLSKHHRTVFFYCSVTSTWFYFVRICFCFMFNFQDMLSEGLLPCT